MPLAVYLPRKTMPPKKYILNLNNWNGWKPIVWNHIKIAYTEIAVERIKAAGVLIPDDKRAILTFTLYKASRRRIDRANVCGCHEKAFCDSMTAAGAIDDDNDDRIESTTYRSGGVDKANPRVEVEIRVSDRNQPELL